MSNALQVRFWGTRGSIPTPGESTVRHGGNTSCLEVRTPSGATLIFDCGSGARLLGHHLAEEATANGKSGPVKTHLFFTHTHWDHIQGFPFFRPVFFPNNSMTIYGPIEYPQRLRETLAGQMQYTYFPVELEQLGAKLQWVELAETAFSLEGVHIQTRYTNHPALTLGYRISAGGKTVVFVPDHEPFASSLYGNPDANETRLDPKVGLNDALRHDSDRRHLEFIAGADLLIHDGQYTSSEYCSKRNWGHSPVEYVVDLAIAGGVRQLALFHHDPEHDDAFLDRLVAGCQARAVAAGSDLVVSAAAEGVSVSLGMDRAIKLNGHYQPMGSRLADLAPRVLVVEDDPVVSRLVEHTLQRDGWRVDLVGTGAEARRHMVENSPTAVILDINLPDQSGLEWLAELRQSADPSHRELPAIVLTGRVSESDIADAFAAGADDHMAKPFSPAQLRARLKGWLRRHEATQSEPPGARSSTA